MTRTTLSLIALLMILSTGVSGAFARDTFTVTYLSAEHVYLDGGKADGLTTTARLRVTGRDGSQTMLEVVFAAEHSSSCTIVGTPGRIAAGDKAVLVADVSTASPAPSDTILRPVLPDTTVAWTKKPRETPRPASTLVNGGVSLVVNDWNDNSDANLDFIQTTGRISLTARRLWGKELSFNLRARVQHDRRARAFGEGVSEDDWDNRIWELSAGYGNASAPVNFLVGRILPRRLGAAGYVDGLLGEWRFSEKFGGGIFGGRDPWWLYNNRGLSLTKGGGYIFCEAGSPDVFRVEQVVGAVGEYHGGVVSREFIVLQGRMGEGRRWGIDHLAEVDVNTGWRKQKSGSTVDLSNLFVNGWTRFGNRSRISLSYDNRTNVWTYENKSLVDSLFDNRLRQGARIQLELSPGPQLWTTAAFGYRKQSGDSDPTFSYSGMMRKNNVITPGTSVGVQAAGFHGPFENGYNYSARATQTFSTGPSVDLAYGGYSYSAASGAAHRNSRWIELSGRVDIGRSYFAGATIEYAWGDAISGVRGLMELGYRF